MRQRLLALAGREHKGVSSLQPAARCLSGWPAPAVEGSAAWAHLSGQFSTTWAAAMAPASPSVPASWFPPANCKAL